MVSLTCTTCATTVDDVEMLKHLSSTRHKTVQYDPLEELVACEDCSDTNIHQLVLLRIGLSDMVLLCQPCLAKDETPSTQYSLSNGSLLKKLADYYKFRDIECKFCGAEKYLGVANLPKEQIIVCRKCQDKIESKLVKIVSEDSDDFLYALLGIKEFVPLKLKLSGKGRGRKIGRKGGKGGRRGPPRSSASKTDNNGEEKSHFHTARAAAFAIKSGQTVLAVGSSGVSPSQSKGNSKANSRSNSRVQSRSTTPVPSGNGGSKNGPKGAKGQKVSGSKDKKAAVKPSGVKSDVTQPKKNSPKSNVDVSSSKDQHQNGPTKKANKPAHEPKSSVPSTKTQERALKAKSPSEKEATKASAQKDSIKSNDARNSKGSISKNHKGKNGVQPDAKGRKVELKKDTKKDTKKDIRADLKNDVKNALKPPPKGSTLVIPPHLEVYQPAKEPPLTYDSMDQYFREISYNLFLEEKLSVPNSHNVFINPEDMALAWYADQDKKHKQFKVNILLSEDILNRLMSKKMQQVKKTPFSVNQSVFLMLGEDIAWYGNIVTAESRSAQKGRRGGVKIFEMVVELYKWNNQPLPTAVDVKWLKILPASIPVSRVFMAMSRIENPKFIKMILGKEPIKQIVFRNFLKFTKDTFNDSQKVAIQSVLNNSITVLQGPPGTGKTSTIYEIILQLLDNLSTYPILVVAASNIAIDNIAEKLIKDHERSILRIVSNEKEKEYTRDHPLGSICLHHKVYDSLPNNLKETIQDLRNPRATVSQNQFKKLLSQQIDVSDTLIAQAKVIFTTTVVAGGNQLKSVKKLPVVIMDEATQSSEPTTLIPLSMPGVEKFVFVGDQKQLSSFSQVPNLSLSLFERVLLNGTYRTPHMLDTQYRMHPAISDFPRRRFYNSLLKDGISSEQRQMDKIPSNPVYFWDTQGKLAEGRVRIGFREDRGFTYSNPGEIGLITEVLTKLIFEKGVSKSDIGVITPYRGQRDLISSVLVKNELINPEHNDILVEVDRDDIYNDSKPVTIHTVSDIMIASIDAFQGREKNFLIMSCVRSNSENKIGFLSDERRLNVALTRAKYGLIIIGDVECLKKGDSLWNEYLEDLKLKESIHTSKEFTY